MFDDSRSFVSRVFLQARFDLDYRAYIASGEDAEVLARLIGWHSRAAMTETQLEAAFQARFFEELWGHRQTGGGNADFTMRPKLGVPGGGVAGGYGEVDLALGWFRGRPDETPQVMCEFKDVRSNLDGRQNRKGANVTPVQQCLNYVRAARREFVGNEPVQPWWALVTDMNEFRLYWWDRAPREYLRFVIANPEEEQGDLLRGHDLLADTEEARFDRFLFKALLHRERLLSRGGAPELWRIAQKQGRRQSEIEEAFYDDYKGVRETMFNALRTSNPDFRGSPSDLLRITQKLLDRFIFVFFCEDMGERMLFPPEAVKQVMKRRSSEPYYEEAGDDIWSYFRRLFHHMNAGGVFGQMSVPHINGGLFATDPEIDALSIPNHVFARHQQWINDTTLATDRRTLMFLAARYNFAGRGQIGESISLYTLGRIFEQSITELEYRTGELENRPTVAKLSKRKRDGVYYTPERIVNYLVDQTLGPWFAAAREAAGVGEDSDPEALKRYEGRLQAIRIVDPACGSGAFLISAFRRLLDERKRVAREIAGREPDEAAIIATILADNLYGVDLNPASVEITKLALWLHSARAAQPLSSLDRTIRCGNSLVGPDFWTMVEHTPASEEHNRPFDWEAAFPEAAGGFDIVLGNPPYVKLQNLMPVYPDQVRYLTAERPAGTYESARTGNFDLYLPFIEKGLRLLAPGGRMAYIAPSLWTANEYGEGLCGVVHRTRQLERWLDFRSFQVFDDAITYTALQFFTREPNAEIRIAAAPDGELGGVDWSDPALAVPTAALGPEGRWLMCAGADRAVIERLWAAHPSLEDPEVTDGIFVGIQTSADHIYHLRRIGDGRYGFRPRRERGARARPPEEVVTIEDTIMKPLVSGEEAQRFETPATDTYLLFPYERDERGRMRLIAAAELERRFPKAWEHLRRWERELRARESNSFDDAEWYRFGRHQGLERQDRTKLAVPRLVQHLACSLDERGVFHLDNVDVGGVAPAAGVDPSYLLAILNGEVANYVFRKVSKPFQHGYFSANRQFIAPIPVPRADATQQAEIGRMARELQTLWTERRDLLARAGRRLARLGRRTHEPRWLWPDLPDRAEQESLFRRRFDRTDARRQAEAEYEEALTRRCALLQGQLDSTRPLTAAFADGELGLAAGGEPVIAGVALDDREGPLAEAHWRFQLLEKRPGDANALVRELCRQPLPDDGDAARQFIATVNTLLDLVAELRSRETAMNERLHQLYGTVDEDRDRIKMDCLGRLPL
jgi:hypothetical protein